MRFLATRRGRPWLSRQVSKGGSGRLPSDALTDLVNRWFEETRIAKFRLCGLLVCLSWVLAWRFGTDATLARSAVGVAPWAAVAVAIAGVWMAVSHRLLGRPDVLKVGGAILNMVCVGDLVIASRPLFAPLAALFPLLTVIAGIQFGRRATAISVVASLAILVTSMLTGATSGNWVTNVAFAVALTVALPLGVELIVRESRAVAVAAIRARDEQNQFFSTMSHELRTSLNAIVGRAQLIDVEQFVGDQRRMIDAIIANANALHRRVNEVLDVAAISGGRVNLKEEPFRLADVLPPVENTCRVLADERGVRLVLAAQSLDSILVGDIGRIEQVLINLTANAVKFTPSGGLVRVVISHMPSKQPGHLCIHSMVTDTGIGIDECDKTRIFEPFEQAGIRDRGRDDGVGLGLYIVKSISDLMHGELSVTDNPGGGTIFQWTIELPFSKESDVVAPQSLLALFGEHQRRIPPLRCLVIDDNATNIEIVDGILSRAGHSVVAATDGASGLKAMLVGGFDLVLLDLHMPHMTGWDVLDRLASGNMLRERPPIIIFSADTDPGSVASAQRLGALAYVTKPVTAKNLLEAIELGYQASPRRKGDARAHSKRAGPGQGTGSASDFGELREILTSGAMGTFLQACMAGLEKSLTALRVSVEGRDHASIAEHAHSLKNEFKILAMVEGVRACDLIAQEATEQGDCRVALEQVHEQVTLAKGVITKQAEFRASGDR
jgi:two-component system sensor histidine kinase RpfC